MYLFLLTVCILSIEASTVPEYIIQKWDNIMKPYKQECMEESGVSSEVIYNILRKPATPDTPPFQKYITCMYLKLGMILEDGNFQEVVIMKTADYLHYNLLKKCVKEAEPEASLLSKSYKLCSCIVKGLEEPCTYTV